MKISLENATIIYDYLLNTETMKISKVTPTISKSECFSDGWTYSFLFYNGVLAKIEQYNHRELIEVFVK